MRGQPATLAGSQRGAGNDGAGQVEPRVRRCAGLRDAIYLWPTALVVCVMLCSLGVSLSLSLCRYGMVSPCPLEDREKEASVPEPRARIWQWSNWRPLEDLGKQRSSPCFLCSLLAVARPSNVFVCFGPTPRVGQSTAWDGKLLAEVYPSQHVGGDGRDEKSGGRS